MYLVFKTYRSAFVANAVISQNMRLAGSVTSGWADVQEIVNNVDGEFALLKPDEAYMEWVANYVEADGIELVGSGEI